MDTKEFHNKLHSELQEFLLNHLALAGVKENDIKLERQQFNFTIGSALASFYYGLCTDDNQLYGILPEQEILIADYLDDIDVGFNARIRVIKSESNAIKSTMLKILDK